MNEILDNDLLETVEETEEADGAGFKLATVSSVTDEGITLTLDGSDTPGAKKYKCAADVLFKAGDRVKLTKDSGSYIVDLILGKPMERYPIPAGGSSGQVLAKDGADDYKLIWLTQEKGIAIPSGGASGKVLGYKSATEVQWVDGIPATGTTGYFLQKTNTGTVWAAAASFPTSGTTGQFLAKTNTGTEWKTVSAYTGPTINGTGTSSLGFFGATAQTRQSLSTTSANQGYTSANSSNYLYIVNNLVGIMKKLGLINQY